MTPPAIHLRSSSGLTASTRFSSASPSPRLAPLPPPHTFPDYHQDHTSKPIIRTFDEFPDNSRIVETQSGIPKWIEPPRPKRRCVVCAGDGKMTCGNCEGVGRMNYRNMAMLPHGQWPIYCKSCKGTGRWFCDRCQGSGEFRQLIGFRTSGGDEDEGGQVNN